MPQVDLTPGGPMTLPQAVSLLGTGGEVYLAPGAYPAAVLTAVPTGPVTIYAAGSTLAGVAFRGAQGITLAGGLVKGGDISVEQMGADLRKPSRDITLDRVEVVGNKVSIRDAAVGVTVRSCYLHDGFTGIVGPGRVSALYQSSDILIEGNRIERMKSDGIQITDWNDVTIVGNVIQDIRDPAGVVHNDGIQLCGGSTKVVIRDNLVTSSNTQLVFVQDQIRPIVDVLIEKNVLRNCGGVAVQLQGAQDCRFVANYVDCGATGDGDLWVRKGRFATPLDYRVDDNIMGSFKVMDGAATVSRAGNVIG